METATLLDAARHGDQSAFEQLVEPHRRELHAHCYRMLGSLHDAEDALPGRAAAGLARAAALRRPQLAAHLAVPDRHQHVAGRDRQAPRAARCRSTPGRPRTRSTAPASRCVETVWIEPYPDEQLGLEDGYAAPDARYEARESVELAFVAAVQHLPATQRAVLILREVLGFSAKEVAESLDTTSPPSTPRCSGRARRSRRRCPPRASRRPCARSATARSGRSSTAT